MCCCSGQSLRVSATDERTVGIGSRNAVLRPSRSYPRWAEEARTVLEPAPSTSSRTGSYRVIPASPRSRRSSYQRSNSVQHQPQPPPPSLHQHHQHQVQLHTALHRSQYRGPGYQQAQQQQQRQHQFRSRVLINQKVWNQPCLLVHTHCASVLVSRIIKRTSWKILWMCNFYR